MTGPVRLPEKGLIDPKGTCGARDRQQSWYVLIHVECDEF